MAAATFDAGTNGTVNGDVDVDDTAVLVDAFSNGNASAGATLASGAATAGQAGPTVADVVTRLWLAQGTD